VNNAIERFLGRGREEIAQVAKETLEGHLRGVLATMTPEEVNEDRLKFADVLQDEAEQDLRKLGLHLDTLKIQHVADNSNYLDSIGRKRIAEILRTAEVAESDAIRTAQEAEAEAHARGEVAKTQARATVQKKQNELRRIRAELDAEARSEEERAVAAAQAARSEAEKELQQIRGELEQLRLQADVTIPAEMARKVRELEEAGNAAPLLEDGRAQAQTLALMAEAWRETRGKAMDMYVLQNLDEIFAQVAKAADALQAREVNLVDGGDGKTMPAYMSAYPATVGALLSTVSDTLGVDITGILTGEGRNGVSSPALTPATKKTPKTIQAAPSQKEGA
jgi:flotillin